MNIHPDTLERLKSGLPFLHTLATLFGSASDKAITEAVDELRQNFPGVDDLTLASFLTYGAKNLAGADGGSLEMLAMGVSFAQMALVLAKPLLDSEAANAEWERVKREGVRHEAP